jgi:hypothetical protein
MRADRRNSSNDGESEDCTNWASNQAADRTCEEDRRSREVQHADHEAWGELRCAYEPGGDDECAAHERI